jgi:S-formylglutathione hydrolase FrmB
MRKAWLIVLTAGCLGGGVLPVGVPAPQAGAADRPGEECASSDGAAAALTVGAPDCFLLPSAHMGARVPVSYYIPPACAPATGRTCPVLYYLHGTGGSYRSGLGEKRGDGGAWVAALTSGPPVDPRTSREPWIYDDRSTWVPRPPIDLIIVAPDGQTQPDGYGPAPGIDTGWFDWNPRYARGGDHQSYDTPAPRASAFLSEEVVPFVDAAFPTAGARQWRAIIGYSQGGFGSYINGMTHPDIWSSLGMESGGALPLVSPGDLVDDSALVTGVAPPAELPFVRLPGLVPSTIPEAVWSLDTLIAEVLFGFGDPVADQAWMRASNPIDLISNVRAWAADGRQSTHLKHFVNDAVPRRLEDYASLPQQYMAEVFEALLFPMNIYMEHVFNRYGIERTFNVGPGWHWDPYQAPYFREQLEHQYANLAHWDGGGSPRPDPVRFDYRSIRTDFTIWGWHVAVAERAAIEFLNLTDVTCNRLTLRGTGVVEITVPSACNTGVDGSPAFRVDLGPGWPVDEPAGLGTSRAYGATQTIELTPLTERFRRTIDG